MADPICIECGKKVSSDNCYYCKPCHSVHWRDNFRNWTSGDSNVDKLIQESQLNVHDPRDIIEWIEY